MMNQAGGDSIRAHTGMTDRIRQGDRAMSTLSDAEELYVYAYPLVLMDVTRQQMTAVSAPSGTRAPVGQFAHLRQFPDDTFHEVSSPNADTLYSSAFLDLACGPVVMTQPDTRGRYFLLPVYDAWSNVIASPGARTTGTEAGAFAIVGPGWTGELPSGLERIDSPTANVWIIGRIQTNGRNDFPFVHSLQNGLTLTPLSAWGTDYEAPSIIPIDPEADTVTPPVAQVARMSADVFWARVAGLLQGNSPAAEDGPIVARLAAAGIEAGTPFDWDALTIEQRETLANAARSGLAAVEAMGCTPPVAVRNTWTIADRTGSYGTDYPLRATIARVGLGSNLPEDAIYPMTRVDHEGKALCGRHDYIMHFDGDDLPPVRGFWSLSMYDERQSFVKNPIDRFAIGDRDPLTFDDDGSFDLYIQSESPGVAREPNWLPAPEGSFNVIFRLYWPQEEILDGTWVPPRVTRVG